MDNDVISKYVVVNSKWELHKNSDDVKIRELWGISLGSEMMACCLDVGSVSDIVKSEIIKFNDVYEYYVRRGYMKRNAFISYPSNQFMTNKARDNIFKSYNNDPWNRQFPYFVEDTTSDYYNSSDNKIRYGYWVVYRDKAVSSKSNYVVSIINNNEPPLMVLTTTSIEGVTIACLDIVEG